jgi:tRNA threonylcarbamoyladenosine biosynthesis protein TsaB
MILQIDTTKPETTFVRLLSKDSKVIAENVWASSFNQSEELIPKIDVLIKANNCARTDLIAMIVNQGPGSYTGQRVGISTANSLALAFNIPIFADFAEFKVCYSNVSVFCKPIKAVYANEPNITKPKPRL